MANLSNINGKFVVEQTTGYVGVGTTDPNYPIEVLNASAEIALNASGGSIYRVQSDSASNFIIRKEGVGDRLVINSAGNSTFAGNVAINGSLLTLGSFNQFSGVDTSDLVLSVDKNNVGGGSSFDIQMDGSTSAFYINNSRNVGIGTDSPDAILNISKTSFSTTFTSADSYIRIGKGENATNGYQFIGFGYNNGSADLVPAYIGYQQTGTPGNYTKGDLVFGTRNVTTNTAPTERMRITSSGKVGISNTNPLFELCIGATPSPNRNGLEFAIANSDAGTNILQSYNRATAAYTPYRIAANTVSVLSGSNAQYTTTFAATGNVGIGTTSPSATEPTGGRLPTGWTRVNSRALEIAAPDFANSGLFLRNSGTTATGTDITGDQYFGDTYIDNRFNSDNGSIYFRTKTAVSPQIRMAIKGNGNVGIGVESPGHKLDVTTSDASTWAVALKNTNTNGYGLFVQGSETTNRAILAAYSGSSYKLWVRGDGNVGIGTTSPSSILHVSESKAGNVAISVQNTNASYSSQIRFLNSTGTEKSAITFVPSDTSLRFFNNGGDRMIITSGGSVTIPLSTTGSVVAIGTTNSAGKLNVGGRILASDDGQTAGMYVTRNLNITHPGSSGTFTRTFNPVTQFGLNKQGAAVKIMASGWQGRLQAGYIVWRNNGGGSNLTAVYYYPSASSGLGETITVGVNSANDNTIDVTFTSWHANSHGWYTKISVTQ